MSFANARVLVAGGTGMIGIPLVKMLLAEGARVRVASLDDPLRCPEGAEFMRLDLTRLDNCRQACRGMEYVFNLLGVKASPAITTTKPASFLVATVKMEMNLMEAARLEGVSGFMLTSSIGVYGPAQVFYEDAVWKSFPSPNDWFSGWSKRVGELQAEAYRIEYGWDQVTIVRPANVYGPFDNFDSINAMVVPSLIKRALSGSAVLSVWGDGSAVRDFIHAEDVARGMLMVAQKNPTEPINLGSGGGHSIRELVEIIAENTEPRPKVVWDTDKPSGDAMRIMDTSRAKALGIEPRLSLAKGVAQTMDWYRQYQHLTGTRYDVYDQTG